ncbi:MAG: 3-keto-5-aminohexanoate cleavage protein [Anaerolineales bacterium]|nr:3-keto-5-aminohexanoate cleavage protein [Anaerolineales bacterium]
MPKKIIITCAITGSSHTPTMSPHLPYTPDDIVQQSVEAAQAGAAVVHLHARNPADGSPSADPGLFREYCARIKSQSDVVISLTSGGATGQTVEQRLSVIRALQPELCTCNLGTLNYGLFPMIPKYAGKWRFEWEEPYLASTKFEPFVSNFSDIEYMLKTLTEETGTRFEFEAYDVGHIYTLAYFMDTGLVKPPVFLQFVMGTMGGIGADVVDNVVFMKRTLDRLIGPDVEWSVLGSGRFQFNVITAGALLGSHVRVGLEDSLYLGKGQLAESNAAQVRKARQLLELLSLEVATPDEARRRLALKGRDRVNF